ncbi:SH3 domain-containing protein [Glycocaulis sp.]|uniref:SH3 domain-containing protein n=1 Tax=Glycocaulis sp. TaxID=1969725 RepID=UPI003D21F5AC
MTRCALAPFLLAVTAALAGAPAWAQVCDTPSGQPVPRFVTLKFSEVRGRIGPSTSHPVRWEYRRQGLPVEIVAETSDWRRVRDPLGEESWMHRRTLSGRRAVHVVQETGLHTRPDVESPETARAEPGAILWLERCRSGWCRLESDGVRGWVIAAYLWGAYAHEQAATPDPDAPAGPPCNGARSAAQEIAAAQDVSGL